MKAQGVYQACCSDPSCPINDTYDTPEEAAAAWKGPVPNGEIEEIVGRAIAKEAWAIEGLPVKALTTGYKLLGRAAIAALKQSS